MSNVNIQWHADICTQVVRFPLGPEFRSPIRSALPTLFISGTLDPNTPPADAEEVRRGFPRSVHLIVENAGHESLPAQEVQSVVVDFFKSREVSGRAIAFSRPRFVSVEEAKSLSPVRR